MQLRKPQTWREPSSKFRATIDLGTAGQVVALSQRPRRLLSCAGTTDVGEVSPSKSLRRSRRSRFSHSCYWFQLTGRTDANRPAPTPAATTLQPRLRDHPIRKLARQVPRLQQQSEPTSGGHAQRLLQLVVRRPAVYGSSNDVRLAARRRMRPRRNQTKRCAPVSRSRSTAMPRRWIASASAGSRSTIGTTA